MLALEGRKPMGTAGDRRNYPLWVRLALFGSHTRKQVMGYFRMSLIFLPFTLIAGLWLRQEGPVFLVPSTLFLIASAFCVLGAVWYLLAARWVDRHGGWGESA